MSFGPAIPSLEPERILFKERVRMGISRARKQGKQLGRPKRLVDRERALSLYAEHRSYRIVASLTGVGKDKIAAIVTQASV